jgi:hypothetical protein
MGVGNLYQTYPVTRNSYQDSDHWCRLADAIRILLGVTFASTRLPITDFRLKSSMHIKYKVKIIHILVSI